MDFHVDSMRESYADVVEYVRLHGKPVAPRGEPTLEIRGATVTLEDPYDALPTGTGRGIVTKLAVVETLQCIAGVDESDTLIAAAPHYAQFVGPDGTMRSTYGARLRDQMPHVETKLRRDPSSRQAVATPWRHEMDAHDGEHSYPCTIALGYSIRSGELHANTTMRSNDVWLGLPYDVFQFCQMQITLAGVLSVEVGTYCHHAWSLHMYERDAEKAEKLERVPLSVKWQPRFYGVAGRTWPEAADRAFALLRGNEPADATVSELEYLNVMLEVLSG